MVLDHEGQHGSRWSAIVSIASKIGRAAQTLNEWVKKAEVESGRRAGVPTELAERLKALGPEVRALVTGKRGEAADHAVGQLARTLIASCAAPVCRSSRPRAPSRPTAMVLVAFDASQSTQRAIERMAGNPAFAGLAVTLVHAEEQRGALGALMDEARTRLEFTALSVATEFVPGEPEAALTRKVEIESFDLRVMGAYGHSRIRSLIIGATTTAMIQACHIPVLLYR